MTYSIGEFSKKTGISTYTLRYYEKEGMIYSIKRKANGLREFTERDLEHLNIILCLKATGMSNADIKHYIDICKQDENTIKERKEIFLIQKERIEDEIHKLNNYLETVKYKIWYYENIEKLGNEADPLNCSKMRKIYDSQKR